MSPILYSSKTCAPCKMTKLLLGRLGVDFIERDITDDKYRNEAYAASGALIVPVLKYRDEVIVGYNPKKLSMLFKR